MRGRARWIDARARLAIWRQFAASRSTIGAISAN
jgi:hypothetical protein